MAVVFVDGISHYTTTAQGETKYARDSSAPVAGVGAFSTPGITPTPSFLNYAGNQYNVPASATREFCCYMNVTSPSSLDQNLWVLFDNDFPQIFALAQPDGSIKIVSGLRSYYGGGYYPAPTGPLLGTVAASSLRAGVQQHHKVQIFHSATVGTVKYWIDGALKLDLTEQNTMPSGNAFDTRVQIGYMNGYPGMAYATFIMSHLLIADTAGDIVGLPRIGGLFPDGVGGAASWTPSAGANWTCVDETTPNDDTDYVESGTVGNVDTYSMQDTAANTGTISGLAVTIRIKKTDANSRFVAAVLRIGGVDYVHPTPQGVPGAYAYLQFIWTVSPATSVAFTKAEVDALFAGYKVTS